MPASVFWAERIHLHLFEATVVTQSLHLVQDSVSVREEVARREVLLVDDVCDVHTINNIDSFLELSYFRLNILHVVLSPVGSNVLLPSRGVPAILKPLLQAVILVHLDKVI